MTDPSRPLLEPASSRQVLGLANLALARELLVQPSLAANLLLPTRHYASRHLRLAHADYDRLVTGRFRRWHHRAVRCSRWWPLHLLFWAGCLFFWKVFEVLSTGASSIFGWLLYAPESVRRSARSLHWLTRLLGGLIWTISAQLPEAGLWVDAIG
jgi:hypothetical protein